MFVHRELYGRFVSCLVFLPRDRYTTPVRVRIADDPHRRVRRDELRVEHAPRRSRCSRACTSCCTSTRRRPRRPSTSTRSKRASPRRPAPGPTTSATRSSRRAARKTGSTLLRAWGDAFPAAYQDDFAAAEALADLAAARAARRRRAPLAVRLDDDADHRADLKLYGVGAQPSLSDVLPRLTNMGVDRRRRASVRRSRRAGLEPRWIKQFRLRAPDARDRRPARRATSSRTRSSRCSTGAPRTTASTGSCSPPGSSWREVALLRAYSRYLRQIGTLVQPDVHRGHARRASRHRAPPRRAVRRPPRSVAATAQARHRSRSSTRSPPRSTRSTSLDEDRILRALLAPRARDAAHELVPDRRRRRAAPVRRAQARPARSPRPAAAPPAVRDLRVLAARRRRAPARRAASRAAASAGRTAAKTSAPRSSA